MIFNRTEKGTWMKAALILASLIFALLLGNANVSAASYKESDYSHIYDYNYYTKKHPVATKGMSKSQALEHFIKVGMGKKWTGNSTFNVVTYRANYPDLRKVYGTNYKLYYLHYQKYGYTQGRIADKNLRDTYFTLKIDPNGGTYAGSKSVTSISKKYNTTVTLQAPTRSGYSFAGWEKTGRGSLSDNKTFKFTNTRQGDTILKATWKQNVSSGKRYAYAYKIADVAKTQLGNHGQPYWDYFSEEFGGQAFEWCCAFVSYCAYKAGFIDSKASYCTFGAGRFPKTASQRELSSMFAKRGQIKLASSGYVPSSGDIIFFSNATNKSDYQSYRHVGIVVGRNKTRNEVYTIEGNTATYDKYTSYVKKKTYPMDSEKIASYGIIF